MNCNRNPLFTCYSIYIQHSLQERPRPDRLVMGSVPQLSKKDIVIQCSEAMTTICLCRHLCVLKLCKQEYGTVWLHPRCVHVRSSSIIDYRFPNLILCLETQLCEPGIHKVKASISRTRKGGILNSRLHLRISFPLIHLDYVLFVSSR